MKEGERKKFDMKRFFKNLQADRPRKKEKIPQPPGNGMRKAGAALFWLVFGFMVLVVVATLATQGEEAATVELPEPNRAAEPEALAFAQTFAREYFTWTATAEGWEGRKNRLAPMLAEGLDEQAGLVTAQQAWSSSLERAEVVQVQETGTNESLVTLSVVQVLTNGEETERVRHTFTVPVGFAEAFGVRDLPSFTAVNTETALEAENPEGGAVGPSVESGIREFLTTFFQSYATDAPDKLGYFFKEPADAIGLQGALRFESVTNAVVRETGTNAEGTAEQFTVVATVQLRDPKTDTKYLVNYNMTIEPNDGRYIVAAINEGGN